MNEELDPLTAILVQKLMASAPVSNQPQAKIAPQVPFTQHSDKPWMTESDARNPSAEFLSLYTSGPLRNETDTVTQMMRRFNRVENSMAAKHEALAAERRRLHNRPYTLK